MGKNLKPMKKSICPVCNRGREEVINAGMSRGHERPETCVLRAGHRLEVCLEIKMTQTSDKPRERQGIDCDCFHPPEPNPAFIPQVNEFVVLSEKIDALFPLPSLVHTGCKFSVKIDEM